MLANTRRTTHQMMKSLGYALLAGAGMTQTALVVFAADLPAGSDLRPLVRINPDYPAQALSGGIEGWVQMEFTVTPEGAVLDPLVVDNCAWREPEDSEDCKPDDMFNSVALAAIAKWRYAPKVENGEAVSTQGVRTIIRFTLEHSADEPEDDRQPQ